MKLIVGLGNFEDKYLFTRHNAGFMAVDFLATSLGVDFRAENKFKSLVAKAKLQGEDVILAKPLTFMNLSGEAVVALCNFYKIDLKDVLIIYDDLSLDLGKVRFRANGSDGGHNGMKSIIKLTGNSNIGRLKIGIGPQPGIPSEAFVLQNFTQEELVKLKEVLKNPMIEDYIKYGIEKSQNLYN